MALGTSVNLVDEPLRQGSMRHASLDRVASASDRETAMGEPTGTEPGLSALNEVAPQGIRRHGSNAVTRRCSGGRDG